MKKVTVIFGGPIPNYAHFYNYFSNLFKIEVQKTDRPYFRGPVYFNGFSIDKVEIKDVLIEFFHCYGPKMDQNWENVNKQDWAQGKLPPPAEEIVKKIKDTDCVLFFGTCGAFIGLMNQVFVPTEFVEIDFSDVKLHPERLPEVKEKIKYDNLLLKYIKGKKARIITTNLSFSPDVTEGKHKDEAYHNLRRVVARMIKHADAVEKETYKIVQGLAGKFPLGLLLVSCDNPARKELAMTVETGERYDPNLFDYLCCTSIALVARDLMKS